MRKGLILFMGIFTTMMAYAQTTITGKITDEDGKPLASASITVEEPGKDAIMAYSISNSKGEYKVTFTSAESSVDIKVKAFNQKPQTQNVKNSNQTVNFTLQNDATEIKEVKLKTKLITKKGDTISYDLKAFESKADRTLADVLKKIPGIEVNPDGSVLYQGEAINKFLVNGKDLMEGGYGTVNNSLPKDAVQKVEVLENHQPIKILQDKVPSDKASLNVVLKKSVTMTGRGEVGAGMAPFLWNVKLTPMFFGQKNQWVVNYKTNNTGESVEKEGNMLGGFGRWEGRRSQATQKIWLSTETAQTPSIPEKRYLLNNVHYFSANLLTNPFKNKEWELKANTSYSNNAVEREQKVVRVYEEGSPIVESGGTFIDSKANNFYNNALKGELIFSKNAKKGFFKNTTTWNSYWNDTKANISHLTPDTEIFADEVVNAPSGMFQNSLSTIVPWKEKLVNVMSYVSFQNDRQTLLVNPAGYMGSALSGYETGKQLAKSNTAIINHSASVGFTYKKFTLTPEVGLNMSFSKLESALYGVNGNSQTQLGADYINDNEWNEVQPFSQLGINYKSNQFNFNLNLPFNFYEIAYKDNFRNNTIEKNKLAFEPSMFASYDFASFFKLWAFAGQSYDFGNFGFLYEGAMYTSPLNSTIRYGSLINMPEYLNRNVGSRLEYRNPLNNLFFNVRFGYNSNKRNIMEKYTSDGINNELSLIAIQNTIISRSQSAEIGKYFPKFKTNASVNFSNSHSNSYAFTNDIISKVINDRQSLGIKFNNTYFKWMSVDYNISFNWSSNENLALNRINKSSGWNHNLATYIYPAESHTFGFFWDDLTSGVSGKSFRNSFFDASYQYTWTKKKIDFELKWLNIGSRKVYESISYDAASMLTTSEIYNIRPSQFLFTVKFNFK
ncbi:MAG: carboxypeptidase regulatory-like domain-containing protein [Bergeyella sp.]